jgi:hypothetical protein
VEANGKRRIDEEAKSETRKNDQQGRGVRNCGRKQKALATRAKLVIGLGDRYAVDLAIGCYPRGLRKPPESPTPEPVQCELKTHDGRRKGTAER